LALGHPVAGSEIVPVSRLMLDRHGNVMPERVEQGMAQAELQMRGWVSVGGRGCKRGWV
jgi:hypothetical protein